MITRNVVLFLTIFWIISCAENDKYGGGSGNAPFNPGGSNLGSPNSSAACAASDGKYGGITCISGSDQDQGFLGFVSSGSSTDPNDPKQGVKSISCKPSDNGGILFRATVVLNGNFNSNGPNQNLTMNPASSQIEMIIQDSIVGEKYTTGQALQPISVVFNGVSGTVNGNQANLLFTFTGSNGLKKVTLKGTFNSNFFTGQIGFENAQYWDGRTPGASGVLGNFKIHTCSVFTSS